MNIKNFGDRANHASHSLAQYLQPPSKTKISLPVMTERLQIAVVPTRTMKALTKISKPIQNRKWAKSLILTIRVVAQIAMLRWAMRIVMLERLNLMKG